MRQYHAERSENKLCTEGYINLIVNSSWSRTILKNLWEIGSLALSDIATHVNVCRMQFLKENQEKWQWVLKPFRSMQVEYSKDKSFSSLIEGKKVLKTCTKLSDYYRYPPFSSKMYTEPSLIFPSANFSPLLYCARAFSSIDTLARPGVVVAP